MRDPARGAPKQLCDRSKAVLCDSVEAPPASTEVAPDTPVDPAPPVNGEEVLSTSEQGRHRTLVLGPSHLKTDADPDGLERAPVKGAVHARVVRNNRELRYDPELAWYLMEEACLRPRTLELMATLKMKGRRWLDTHVTDMTAEERVKILVGSVGFAMVPMWREDMVRRFLQRVQDGRINAFLQHGCLGAGVSLPK